MPSAIVAICTIGDSATCSNSRRNRIGESYGTRDCTVFLDT
jgi:hypothetical protein